jgi:hypothetical protein
LVLTECAHLSVTGLLAATLDTVTATVLEVAVEAAEVEVLVDSPSPAARGVLSPSPGAFSLRMSAVPFL